LHSTPEDLKHPRVPSSHSKKGMLVDSTMTSLGTMLKNKKNLMRNSATAVNNIKRDIIELNKTFIICTV
jgi:hypothetical protein